MPRPAATRQAASGRQAATGRQVATGRSSTGLAEWGVTAVHFTGGFTDQQGRTYAQAGDVSYQAGQGIQLENDPGAGTVGHVYLTHPQVGINFVESFHIAVEVELTGNLDFIDLATIAADYPWIPPQHMAVIDGGSSENGGDGINSLRFAFYHATGADTGVTIPSGNSGAGGQIGGQAFSVGDRLRIVAELERGVGIHIWAQLADPNGVAYGAVMAAHRTNADAQQSYIREHHQRYRIGPSRVYYEGLEGLSPWYREMIISQGLSAKTGGNPDFLFSPHAVVEG